MDSPIRCTLRPFDLVHMAAKSEMPDQSVQEPNQSIQEPSRAKLYRRFVSWAKSLFNFHNDTKVIGRAEEARIAEEIHDKEIDDENIKGYEALSYTWGDPTVTKLITLDVRVF
jgi:hypothetical protein